MLKLDEYLSYGCADVVDAIAWHAYPSFPPENMVASIEAVRDVMRRHGIADKPLWNTEGAVGNAPLDQAPAAVARVYLVQWAYGVESFSWFMWDEIPNHDGDDNPDTGRVLLHDEPIAQEIDANTGMTPAGKAYKTVVSWLVGARMVDKSILPLDNGGEFWQLTLDRNGTRSYIVWVTEGSTTFTIPASWGVTTRQALVDDPVGASVNINTPIITVGIEPTLLF